MSDASERVQTSPAGPGTDVTSPAPSHADRQEAAPAEGEGTVERPGLRAIVLRFAAVGLLVLLDLWSKAAAFEWLTSGEARMERDACEYPHARVELVGDWFAFMLSRNKGAAFGKLDSVPYLLIGGRVAAVLFLSYLIVRTSSARRVLSAAFVLILAGALGNLYDNLVLDPPSYDAQHPFGYVRDFIDVYFTAWNWHFPTFNIADSCITVGAVLLLWSGFRGESQTA